MEYIKDIKGEKKDTKDFTWLQSFLLHIPHTNLKKLHVDEVFALGCIIYGDQLNRKYYWLYRKCIFCPQLWAFYCVTWIRVNMLIKSNILFWCIIFTEWINEKHQQFCVSIIDCIVYGLSLCEITSSYTFRLLNDKSLLKSITKLFTSLRTKIKNTSHSQIYIDKGIFQSIQSKQHVEQLSKNISLKDN